MLWSNFNISFHQAVVQSRSKWKLWTRPQISVVRFNNHFQKAGLTSRWTVGKIPFPCLQIERKWSDWDYLNQTGGRSAASRAAPQPHSSSKMRRQRWLPGCLPPSKFIIHPINVCVNHDITYLLCIVWLEHVQWPIPSDPQSCTESTEINLSCPVSWTACLGHCSTSLTSNHWNIISTLTSICEATVLTHDTAPPAALCPQLQPRWAWTFLHYDAGIMFWIMPRWTHESPAHLYQTMTNI